MSVVDFRPHSLRYRIKGEITPVIYNDCEVLLNNDVVMVSKSQGHTNYLGDYIPAPHKFSEPYPCNAVPSKGEAVIKYAEGKKTEYSFTLYCDANVKDFEYGEIIRLDREGIIYELSVKGFQRYSRVVKIWV